MYFKLCVRCPRKWVAVLEFLAYFFAFIVICLVVNWADKIMVDTRNVTIAPTKMTTSQKRKQRTVADVILSTLKIIQIKLLHKISVFCKTRYSVKSSYSDITHFLYSAFIPQSPVSHFKFLLSSKCIIEFDQFVG